MVKACLDQIRDFIEKPELSRPEKNVVLDGTAYRFENVSFAYNETDVLKNVSFEINPSTVSAIVGPSGSGKSTIAKLMAGFWDTTKGKVIFGGKNIKEIPFAQLMDEVSYVAQDNFLFDESIRENIRIGKPSATDDEVVAAAKAACCHDFIVKLENGYDTNAGDAGGKLSGGERQRITIARAILKNARVIILDEATAYADPENEYLIQSAISKLVSGGVVDLKITEYPSYLRLDVSDNGIGIPEEEQAKIFGRFYRGKQSAGVDGVGIGLYLTRDIVNKQNGYIKVASDEKGTTFSLFLKKFREQ